ncbi:uncharacterized protein Z520_10678 [Fonsecaea multimorphosa CBS 102226]|uniref:Uncharacterized protein n=1 Tax=Fonsecaea multimorphosa CBS 102226 TaxID=1442371 RepID=A0A0D2GVA6_9EURO|nr:uncharacterized protein Z520_10678 [Fonsecaea multimorphosa CBS 102226]KIX93500.1 hypothetical protein Z520_10678 [Fonsecaea multimorphosa CBS 102226]OAL18816.1 hypothetical protein AYO22_10145 [Fonsecaea multimorphosa]
MASSNPTSPTLPALSPLSPHSSRAVEKLPLEPLPTLVTTFSAMTPTQPSMTSPSPWSNTNGTICRRNSLASPMMSPAQAAFAPISPAQVRDQIRTPERAHFQFTHTPMTPSFPREDGRQSRMAMRSPAYEKVLTLPLRVNTIFSGETIQEEDQSECVSIPLSDSTTPLDWAPAIATTSASPTANGRRLVRSHTPAPILTQTRSPIRKQSHKNSRLPAKPRLPPPPKYHVKVIPTLSPTTQRNRQHYLSSVEHLRAPLVPLISVTTGLPHPEFPTSLLQYHLLTHEQLDSLARWYHQVTPPVEETFQYPAWIPAWTSLYRPRSQTSNTDGEMTVDLETKKRRWGRFIGLRGCESPTDEAGNVMNGNDCQEESSRESSEELARRMEREWRRALERAEEEARAYEKSWRGRW